MLFLHYITVSRLILLIVINWGEEEILFLDWYSFLFISIMEQNLGIIMLSQ